MTKGNNACSRKHVTVVAEISCETQDGRNWNQLYQTNLPLSDQKNNMQGISLKIKTFSGTLSSMNWKGASVAGLQTLYETAVDDRGGDWSDGVAGLSLSTELNIIGPVLPNCDKKYLAEFFWDILIFCLQVYSRKMSGFETLIEILA